MAAEGKRACKFASQAAIDRSEISLDAETDDEPGQEAESDQLLAAALSKLGGSPPPPPELEEEGEEGEEADCAPASIVWQLRGPAEDVRPSAFCSRITTCYRDRAATGPHFVPGLPHVVLYLTGHRRGWRGRGGGEDAES